MTTTTTTKTKTTMATLANNSSQLPLMSESDSSNTTSIELGDFSLNDHDVLRLIEDRESAPNLQVCNLAVLKKQKYGRGGRQRSTVDSILASGTSYPGFESWLQVFISEKYLMMPC